MAKRQMSDGVRQGGRRAMFWVAVGGASILANFTLELAARYIKNPGFQHLVNFIHAGPGGKDY